MSLYKYLSIFLLSLVTSKIFGQDNNSVTLKWKLKPNEVITYKTVMQEIDTANFKGLAFNAIPKTITDKSETIDAEKLIKQLNKISANSNYTVSLKKSNADLIDIEMHMAEIPAGLTKDTSKEAVQARGMQNMMLKLNGGIVLRGTIHENGTIESFYTKNEQRNLLSIFFELPGKPIKAGDSWPLDVHFISMDQNFKCDSSFRKNKVTAISLLNGNDGQVVTLQYDLEEYVTGSFYSPIDNREIKSSMKMTTKAIGYFSIDKGRWLEYNGVMALTATGIMSSQTVKKIALVPN